MPPRPCFTERLRSIGATASRARLSIRARRSDTFAGFSYFVGDAEAARGTEKILLPGVDWQKRALGLCALTEIRDPKSAEFVREKVLKAEQNQAAIGFLSAVISVLSGTDNGGDASVLVVSYLASPHGDGLPSQSPPAPVRNSVPRNDVTL